MNTRNNEEDKAMGEDLSEELEEEPLRLGRRESEPHAYEVVYLFEVLSYNFPESRTFLDLHHYFHTPDKKLDLLFDITYFPGLKQPEDVPFYDSAGYDNRVPEMAINILSTRTWKKDGKETVEICNALRIPIYIYFTPYNVAPQLHQAPYLRVYILDSNMDYKAFSVNEIAAKEGVEGFDSEKMISLAPKLNLSVGLELLKRTYKGGFGRFRLFFVDLTKNERIKTKKEMSDQRADKAEAEKEREKAEADKAEAEKEREKARADKAKAEKEREKARANKEKARADKAENKVEELETEIKKLKDLLRKKN